MNLKDIKNLVRLQVLRQEEMNLYFLLILTQPIVVMKVKSTFSASKTISYKIPRLINYLIQSVS
jgi:hypothetical protein